VLNASQIKRLDHLKSLSNPSILVQRADRLGDAIFISPVIEQLYEAFPNATINLLTSSVGCELFYHHPYIKSIRICRSDVLTDWASWFQEVQFLKQQGYDAYVSLWNHPRLAWLGFAANIPIRCGDSSSLILSICYNHSVSLPWANATCHQTHYNSLVLSGLGIKEHSTNRTIYPDPASYQAQYKHWKQVISLEKTVVILCGTGGSSDPIPSQSIIEWLTTSNHLHSYHVILVGQLNHSDPLTSFNANNVWNKVNQTSLAELITLIDLADVVIGGDTGPSHIASFLNKPLIFYSPLKTQLPSAWGPLSDYAVIIRYDYFTYSDKTTPLIKQLDEAFYNLTHNSNLHIAKTEEEKHHRLLKHSIRVLTIERSHLPFSNNDLSCFKELQNQGLILFKLTLSPIWIFQLFSIIHIIRQRNITVIMAHTLPAGLLWIIRFTMGTIFQYRKPIFVSLAKLLSYNLSDLWSILKTKTW
tara:strand:+ start:5161 stop:6576 length:1416 start_codon:yes stop_codon:yes gene_type:complete